jgi:hypothetical protein
VSVLLTSVSMVLVIAKHVCLLMNLLTSHGDNGAPDAEVNLSDMPYSMDDGIALRPLCTAYAS